MENTIELTDIEEMTKHQLGMLITGALAGFFASKLTHKAYKMAIEAYRAHNATSTEVN